MEINLITLMKHKTTHKIMDAFLPAKKPHNPTTETSNLSNAVLLSDDILQHSTACHKVYLRPKPCSDVSQ